MASRSFSPSSQDPWPGCLVRALLSSWDRLVAVSPKETWGMLEFVRLDDTAGRLVGEGQMRVWDSSPTIDTGARALLQYYRSAGSCMDDVRDGPWLAGGARRCWVKFHVRHRAVNWLRG